MGNEVVRRGIRLLGKLLGNALWDKIIGNKYVGSEEDGDVNRVGVEAYACTVKF